MYCTAWYAPLCPSPQWWLPFLPPLLPPPSPSNILLEFLLHSLQSPGPGTSPALTFGIIPFFVGKDGRAGMASLVLQKNESLNCQKFYTHVTDRLPNYACPKFVRIKESIEVTGTYKHRKVNLIKEGFDPRSISDAMFYMNDKEKTYSILDEEAFNSIQSGSIRM